MFTKSNNSSNNCADKLDNCKKFWSVRFFLILVVGSLIGAISSNTLNVTNQSQANIIDSLKQTDKLLDRKIKSNTKRINNLEQKIN